MQSSVLCWQRQAIYACTTCERGGGTKGGGTGTRGLEGEEKASPKPFIHILQYLVEQSAGKIKSKSEATRYLRETTGTDCKVDIYVSLPYAGVQTVLL